MVCVTTQGQPHFSTNTCLLECFNLAEQLFMMYDHVCMKSIDIIQLYMQKNLLILRMFTVHCSLLSEEVRHLSVL